MTVLKMLPMKTVLSAFSNSSSLKSTFLAADVSGTEVSSVFVTVGLSSSASASSFSSFA